MPQGSIVLKSTHHPTTHLDLSRVVVNEVKLIGSRCGRFRDALNLLLGGAVDVRPLITDRFPIEQGLTAFEMASNPQSMKVLLQVGATSS